jgi:hypothetical protein
MTRATALTPRCPAPTTLTVKPIGPIHIVGNGRNRRNLAIGAGIKRIAIHPEAVLFRNRETSGEPEAIYAKVCNKPSRIVSRLGSSASCGSPYTSSPSAIKPSGFRRHIPGDRAQSYALLPTVRRINRQYIAFQFFHHPGHAKPRALRSGPWRCGHSSQQTGILK